MRWELHTMTELTESPNGSLVVIIVTDVSGIPPGYTFDYKPNLGDQVGTYWMHTHVPGSYPDGLRSPLIVHDPDPPKLYKKYDVEGGDYCIRLGSPCSWSELINCSIIKRWKYLYPSFGKLACQLSTQMVSPGCNSLTCSCLDFRWARCAIFCLPRSDCSFPSSQYGHRIVDSLLDRESYADRYWSGRCLRRAI